MSENAISKKLKVAVVFGGRSAEHEVSILSARAIIAGLANHYQVIPLAISRQGTWLSPEKARQALEQGSVEEGDGNISVSPGSGRRALIMHKDDGTSEVIEADVVFPILHGTFGEDGTIQGLFEMADIAYVGAGVSASSVSMDKTLMYDIWRSHGLPVLPKYTALRSELESDPEAIVKKVVANISFPCFVKPANLGSSVGISCAKNCEELLVSMREAAKYDRKIIIEKAVIAPREVEMGVIGNDVPQCSKPGELVYKSAFYDYESKYWSDEKVEMRIPANLPAETVAKMEETAKAAWSALDLNGLGRMDFFVDKKGDIWINEVNTMPGFTNFSMFSALWDKTGKPYSELLDDLISLAIDRYDDRHRNLVSAR